MTFLGCVEKAYDCDDVVCDKVVYHFVCEYGTVPDAVEVMGLVLP